MTDLTETLTRSFRMPVVRPDIVFGESKAASPISTVAKRAAFLAMSGIMLGSSAAIRELSLNKFADMLAAQAMAFTHFWKREMDRRSIDFKKGIDGKFTTDTHAEISFTGEGYDEPGDQDMARIFGSRWVFGIENARHHKTQMEVCVEQRGIGFEPDLTGTYYDHESTVLDIVFAGSDNVWRGPETYALLERHHAYETASILLASTQRAMETHGADVKKYSVD